MEQYILFNILGNRDEVNYISFDPVKICPPYSLAIDGSMGFGELRCLSRHQWLQRFMPLQKEYRHKE